MTYSNKIATSNRYQYDYSDDDLKQLAKLKQLKISSYCLSVMSFALILKYWKNDPNLFFDGIASISFSAVACLEYMYAYVKEEKINTKCRKKVK